MINNVQITTQISDNFLHVAYKIAAELGTSYTEAVSDNEIIIAKHVSENLYERHVKPLFL